MPTLTLRFAVVLENFSVDPFDPVSGERRHGPLFHKWLPDGEKDALELQIDEPEAELRVWFEQNGFIEDGRIKFDYERKELDARVIGDHPVLDGGPLMGTLKLPDVSDDVLEAIQENRMGDPLYVAFGRRIAHMIHGPVNRLLNVLRTNYGQYWINELREWNPREQSLGNYFTMVVQTRWSLDDGLVWFDFHPDAPVVTAPADNSPENYHALLTREDWGDLQKALNEGYDPKLAAQLLTRTHQLIEREDICGATIHAVLAVEVALNEFIHRKTRMNKHLADHLNSFSSLPLSVRLATVATLSGSMTPHQVDPVLKLLEMHGKIIRDGWLPPVTAREEILRALQTISVLLPGPSFKFPSYFTEAPVVETSPRPRPILDESAIGKVSD